MVMMQTMVSFGVMISLSRVVASIIKYSLSCPYEKVLTSAKLTILWRRMPSAHLLAWSPPSVSADGRWTLSLVPSVPSYLYMDHSRVESQSPRTHFVDWPVQLANRITLYIRLYRAGIVVGSRLCSNDHRILAVLLYRLINFLNFLIYATSEGFSRSRSIRCGGRLLAATASAEA